MSATVTGKNKNTNVSLTGISKGGLISKADSFLIKEDGFYILQENGFKLLLDNQNFSQTFKSSNAVVTGITKT